MKNDAEHNDAARRHQPPRTASGTSYRHEALFYAGEDELIARAASFIRASIAAEEPVLTVLRANKLDALRQVIDSQAAVVFADMDEIGMNPARIIPAWQSFLDLHSAPGRRVRGIGEPISSTRNTAELSECARHEALLNLAFASADFWLVCPYDTLALESHVIETAHRNHPFLDYGGVVTESDGYLGAERFAMPLSEVLSPPPAHAWSLQFDAMTLRDARAFIVDKNSLIGLSADRLSDLELAVHEVATNSVVHGGGHGSLFVWREPGAVICELRDGGRIIEPLVGRQQPDLGGSGGRGLWLTNQLCDLVQIRVSRTGSLVRIRMNL